jgi:DNA primase
MTPEEMLIKKKIPYDIQGANWKIRCLNPDHEDRNPSLLIDRITGIFNCFSCGFRGNIFDHFGHKANFLTQKRQMLQTKIKQKLADSVGLEIPANAVPFEDDWRGISGQTYKTFEAFQHNDRDYIGRVVFPIRTISDRIVGFTGRHMSGGDPKYLNTPTGTKFPLYPSRPEIYNGRIILVEGMFDMLNLFDKGLRNSVCAFGTVKLLNKDRTEATNKLNLYKLQGVFGIDVFFDGDDPGQKAAQQVKELCESLEFDTRNVVLPDKDPGELTASQVLKLKEKLYG